VVSADVRIMGEPRSGPVDGDAWSWPLDVAAYDSSPELSSVETKALAEVIDSIDRPRTRLDQFPPDLHRLLRPVEDVLEHTGSNGHVRVNLFRIVAIHSHERQRSPWGWTDADWAQLLNRQHSELAALHVTGDRWRADLVAVAYLLGGFCDWQALGRVERFTLAGKIFGKDRLAGALQAVLGVLSGWGYRGSSLKDVRLALCCALLTRRSPRLQDLDVDLLRALQAKARKRGVGYVALSRALAALGLIERPLEPTQRRGDHPPLIAADGVPAVWAEWCRRWYRASTLRPDTRDGYYALLLKAGRWLMATHPDVASPEQWTCATAAAFVATVERMVVGQWALPNARHAGRVGQPLVASSKASQLTAVRTFFRDCQEWGWMPRRFDPRRVFATPRSTLALIAPRPNVVADDVWAKLVWAGLNLTESDLVGRAGGRHRQYPLTLVRAVAAAWLFAGLRNDEVRRLRVGCVRRQPAGGDGAPICLLDVPANKTGPGFTKPVDRVVGETIAAWEAVRPPQERLPDPTTGELVHYLFAYRGRRLGGPYLNETLIPLLCRKAGIPEADARGNITSHRARATIATQLYNAKEPLTLFELQAWLGHRSPSSTQHYAKLTPTKLARAYADADYFTRNVRTMTVLLDQDALRDGAAARGETWKLYDLGHGYCSYDFFDQCPHRMACAKCAFYVPKGSSRAQAVEGKANLLRMLQEIPLTEDERAAVEDGAAAFDRLLDGLADVPTPEGPTPRQLGRGRELGREPPA
jgi:integrase